MGFDADSKNLLRAVSILKRKGTNTKKQSLVCI